MKVKKVGYTDKSLGSVKLEVDGDGLDFEKAKAIAKQKASEFCSYPLLLSWCNGRTGEFYPKTECAPGEKPAWIVYAEARGGDIRIDINDGEFVFIFLSTE